MKMKTEEIYVRSVIAILTIPLFWGLICPILVSAQTDWEVILGIILIFFEPFLIFKIIMPIFKKEDKKKEENSEETSKK